MKDMSNWLEVQTLANLARYADRPPQELDQVIVTSGMTEAAMEYVYSLHAPLISIYLLEEVFRIMAVLQPKALVGREQRLERVSILHQNQQKSS